MSVQIQVNTGVSSDVYNVLLEEDIGRGAFGNVYKATVNNGETVAAKKISLRDHPDAHIHEAWGFYSRPPDHENIIKLLGFTREGGNFWIFMEYAQHSDLDKYFRDHFQDIIDIKKKVVLMKQIACGVAYLHSHNIVHRDIKPCNVLVSGGYAPEETVLKITDLGLARHLNSVDTSAMSSICGTELFKAPEFWRFSPVDGKICYHRNVDTFAAGLTFLAMLQAREGQHLIPILEGNIDHKTESRLPIGLVMFNRENHKQTSIHPVEDKGSDSSLTRGVKQMIRRMIQMVPEYRQSMKDVYDVLSNKDDIIRQAFAAMRFRHVKTFRTQFHEWEGTKSCRTQEGEVIVYGIPQTQSDVGSTPCIHKYNSTGEMLQRWDGVQCGHDLPTPIFHLEIANKPYLVVSCVICRNMTLINTRDGSRMLTYTDGKRDKPVPGRMCDGPSGKLIAINFIQNRSEAIIFDCKSTKLKVSDLIPNAMEDPVFIAYLETESVGGLVIACDWKPNTIIATSLSDKQLIWRLKGEVAGKKIRPNGMCTDDKGRLYAADGTNSRILVLDGTTGCVLQVKEIPEYGDLVNVLWCDTQCQLIVHHVNDGYEKITYFDIV